MKGKKPMHGIIAALLCAMMLLACVPLGAAETATPGEATPSEPCVHPNASVSITLSNKAAYAPVDEETHSYTADERVEKNCSLCGWHQVFVNEGKTFTEAHAFDENGRCTVCGYCLHKLTDTNEEVVSGSDQYEDNGANHTHSWSVHRTVVCRVCNETINDEYVTDSEVENHRYGGGECFLCHAACPHEHTLQHSKHFDWENLKFVSYNNEVHVLSANLLATIVCTDCGETIGRNAVVEENVELVEQHSFDEEGNCTTDGCGAKSTCLHNGTTHTEVYTDYLELPPRATSVDDKQHKIPGIEVTLTVCDLCNSVIDEVVVEKDLLKPHRLSNGRCTTEGCGYVGTGCQHENEKVEFEDILQRNPKSLGHDEHEYTVDVRKVTSCDDCGLASYTIIQIGVKRTDEHTFKNGVCTVCGEVEHPNRKTKQVFGQMDMFEPIDEHTHSFLADVYEVVTCADCGEEISRKLIASAAPQTGLHEFNEEGQCVWCRYCTHQTTLKSTNNVEGSERYEDSGDGKTHIKTWDVLVQTYCTVCGTVVDERILDDSEQEMHDDQETCVCGYVKPAPAETPTPTPVPTPTPTPEPENNYEPTSRPNRTPAPTAKPVVVPVVTPEPTVVPTAQPTKKPIVETLFEAVAEAEAEGKEVAIEIVGAQEVMTQEEYTELKTLSAQEQVLVTLKSVGLDEVVQAAMTAMNVTVSGEAQGLMDKVSARVEAMTAEEKTAYEDKLAEFFPVTERVIDGVKVRTFTIDMKVVVDGFERVERYQFYLDENGEWIFEKVDLASFGQV